MSLNNNSTLFKGLNTLDIQKRIIEERKKAKLSQGELADKLDIPRSTYAYHEKKATELSIEFVEKVSNALNVPYDYLCTGILSLRSPEPPKQEAEGFPVTNKEKKIIEKYRLLPVEARKEIQSIVEDLYSKYKIKP